MAKIDIYSGFLGAGKTTLIKKMISEAYVGQRLVLVENEFGEIGIDSGFLQDAGIQITEMNSGCICCSLVGDFGKALEKVIDEFSPDRIIIEPSGVGKLSDVISAVKNVDRENICLDHAVAVVDAGKVKTYMRNFGEFYNNQVESASTIILSRTDVISQQKLDDAISLLKERNHTAAIVTTPWNQLTGIQILEAMDGSLSVSKMIADLEKEHHHSEHCCHHDHHDHHEHEECSCHNHHEHHHHHHHEHHHGCSCHSHHEHHEHHEGCCCHEHHDHHADEVFTSWGVETAKKFTPDMLQSALEALDTGSYGAVLRGKGIVPSTDNAWIYFDYVPGEINIRVGNAATTGKLCVIGAQLKEAEIAGLFGV